MDAIHDAVYTLAIAWGIVTIILLCVVIYRSTLTSHEDDQLFLDNAEDSLAGEQQALTTRIDRLNRPIRLLIFASGALLVVTAGVWLWEGFRNF